MKIFRICLLLCVNLVATVVAYNYRRCYASFSLCLITNTIDDEYNWTNKILLTQSSAINWCKSQSSSLVIITNETVQSAVDAFGRDPSAKLVDVDVLTNGFRFNLNAWEWINGRQSTILPRVSYSTSLYVYLVVSSHRSNYLSDGYAHWDMKFICSYVTHNSRCSSGFRQIGSRCYKIYERKATWFAARNTCLQEESDLVTFEEGISSLTSVAFGQYWIGLRKERWDWANDHTNSEEMKYSNWEDNYPYSPIGDCLCLNTWTGRWTNCDCLQTYRYICIQDYASRSTSTVTTQLTGLTTEAPNVNTTTSQMTTTTQTSTITTAKMTTTKMTTTTKQIIITTTTKLQTTSHFHSTSTQTLDDDFGSKMSENSEVTAESGQTSGFLLPIIGIGVACLLILIVAIVVVVFIKNRRSRSGDHEPTHGNSPPPMTYKDDAPNTVYAAVIANTNDPVYSAAEQNSNQTVYAELDLEPKMKISPTQRTSNPGRFASVETPSQAVYAEVNLVPKENVNGRPEGPSEYDNIQMVMDSVYANSAQTRV